ncbi:MAG TPA: hypothetical protein VFN20_12705, partial [Candidatus Acidoferrum sp.]|nr:hypothetical protein [Candidatus Acidoferrum sp.]
SDLGGGERGERALAFPLKAGADIVSESGVKAARTGVVESTKTFVWTADCSTVWQQDMEHACNELAPGCVSPFLCWSQSIRGSAVLAALW